MKCEECNKKIEKDTEAYIEKKEVCQSCYFKIKNKDKTNKLLNSLGWIIPN